MTAHLLLIRHLCIMCDCLVPVSLFRIFKRDPIRAVVLACKGYLVFANCVVLQFETDLIGTLLQ